LVIALLSAATASRLGISSITEKGTVACVFGSGVWIWKDSTGWQKLTAATSTVFAFA
jgi:hypothetical protein